jgi:hypothetical protein
MTSDTPSLIDDAPRRPDGAVPAASWPPRPRLSMGLERASPARTLTGCACRCTKCARKIPSVFCWNISASGRAPAAQPAAPKRRDSARGSADYSSAPVDRVEVEYPGRGHRANRTPLAAEWRQTRQAIFDLRFTEPRSAAVRRRSWNRGDAGRRGVRTHERRRVGSVPGRAGDRRRSRASCSPSPPCFSLGQAASALMPPGLAAGAHLQGRRPPRRGLPAVEIYPPQAAPAGW